VHDLLGGVNLVPIQAVQQGHTNHRCLDPGMVGQGRENGALHFDIDHPVLAQLLQVGHLVVLAELAEGPVQATLSLVKVVGAQRLANNGIVWIIGTGQGL